jgi:hypothetical protein
MLSTKNSTSWFFFVAEVLGDREGRQRDAGRGSRRLVHLTEHQRRLGLRHGRRRIDRPSTPRHFVPEVVALAGALADAGEHREAAVALAMLLMSSMMRRSCRRRRRRTGRSCRPCGTGEQVDDLDAGLEHFDATSSVIRTAGFPAALFSSCVTLSAL